MDNGKNDAYYIEKIVKDLNFISFHIDGVTISQLNSDEVLQDSMAFRLIQISENAGKLTNELKEKNKEIPWGDIAGLRNRIVHDYGNVDLRIVFNTLKNDIPELRNMFIQL